MFRNMFFSKFFKSKFSKLPKIVVVLGPTASGKTDLGLELAKKFNGEIINADSRQVYKEMNIGTAKPMGEWQPPLTPPWKVEKAVASLSQNDKNQIPAFAGMTKKTQDDNKVYIVEEVPHYLMDVINPDEEFTLADFKLQAQIAIKDILSRGKLPIIVGGTGLYIWSLVDNLEIPKTVPNKKLRAELEKKSLDELVEMLKKEDPESAATIDLKNPRRVLRALEVALSSGESFKAQQKKGESLYNVLQIGINMPREILYERINKRVDKQMEDGLLEETKQLVEKYSHSPLALHLEGEGFSFHDNKLDPRLRGDDKLVWDLPSMSGIGYRQMGYFLRDEMTLPEAVEILKRDTRHYAKRQITWFKRDKRINWVDNLRAAEKLVKKFI